MSSPGENEPTEFRHLRDVQKTHSAKYLRRVHYDLVEAVAELKRSESKAIRALQNANRLLVHRFLGYGSLKLYAIKTLGLRESEAKALVAVTRAATRLPHLLQKIEASEITIYKAARILSVLTETNCDEWLDRARDLSKNKLEKAVSDARSAMVPSIVPSMANNRDPKSREADRQVLSPRKDHRPLEVNERLFVKLERVQAIENRLERRHSSLQQALETLVDGYLSRRGSVIRNVFEDMNFATGE